MSLALVASVWAGQSGSGMKLRRWGPPTHLATFDQMTSLPGVLNPLRLLCKQREVARRRAWPPKGSTSIGAWRVLK